MIFKAVSPKEWDTKYIEEEEVIQFLKRGWTIGPAEVEVIESYERELIENMESLQLYD